jgi:hypothetical protein
MANYRAGRYEQAIEWLNRSLKDAMTHSFLAMAQQRLGRRDAARAALAASVRALDGLRPGERLLAEVVRREADALLQERK